MQWRLRSVQSHGVVCCVISGSFLVLTLICLPETVAAQASTAGVPLYSQDFSDADELQPLTSAQQEARDLATVLIGKKDSTTAPTPIPTTPLALFSEQSLRPGKRLVVMLGTWKGRQMRLVSGKQTFASPVEVTPPMLLRHRLPPLDLGADTALALEVLDR